MHRGLARAFGPAAAEDEAVLFLQSFDESDNHGIGLVQIAAGEESVPILAAAAPDMMQPVGAVGQGAVEIDDDVHERQPGWADTALRRTLCGGSRRLGGFVFEPQALGHFVNGHPVAGGSPA